MCHYCFIFKLERWYKSNHVKKRTDKAGYNEKAAAKRTGASNYYFVWSSRAVETWRCAEQPACSQTTTEQPSAHRGRWWICIHIVTERFPHLVDGVFLHLRAAKCSACVRPSSQPYPRGSGIWQRLSTSPPKQLERENERQKLLPPLVSLDIANMDSYTFYCISRLLDG